MASSTDKARRTRVKRIPYWVPTDDNGRGAWRYLPADLGHTARIDYFDDDGLRIGSRGVYEAKGWISAHDMRMQDAKDPRLGLLPENWKAIGRGDTRKAEWSDDQRKALAKHSPAPPDAA